MIINKILIDNCKCKIIFLITGIKHTTDIEAIPRKYKSELKQLMKDLQEYIPEGEYKSFFSDILKIPLQSAVEEAEDIIKNIHKNRGLDNGQN